MLYVYRDQPSVSARDLATALEGRRLRRPENIRPGDIVVCWGSRINVNLPANVRTLNNVAVGNKLSDVDKLIAAQVPTITYTRQRPAAGVGAIITPAVAARAAVAARDPFMESLRANGGFLSSLLTTQVRWTPAQMTEFLSRTSMLQQAFALPVQAAQAAVAAVAEVRAQAWLPRIINHVGGLDLLQPPPRPEFWVRKEELVREYRVHSFLGRSIRSAVKVARDDAQRPAQPSAWVRSWDGGWKMSYADGALNASGNRGQAQRIRDIAHQAVRALGLEFGAVDIGEKADGSLIVLEVNRAPGLSEGTAEVYGNAINRWSRGELAAAEAA